MYDRLSRRLLTTVLVLLAFGCAPAAVKSSSSLSAKAPVPSSVFNVTGVWQGRSFADCPIVTITDPGRCGAVQSITLTMFQQGSSIHGSYRCAFGTENCRDLAEIGVIRGQMTARLMRIMVVLDDYSVCRFTAMPQNGILEGRYQCHWGGPMELGGFRLERSY